MNNSNSNNNINFQSCISSNSLSSDPVILSLPPPVEVPLITSTNPSLEVIPNQANNNGSEENIPPASNPQKRKRKKKKKKKKPCTSSIVTEDNNNPTSSVATEDNNNPTSSIVTEDNNNSTSSVATEDNNKSTVSDPCANSMSTNSTNSSLKVIPNQANNNVSEENIPAASNPRKKRKRKKKKKKDVKKPCTSSIVTEDNNNPTSLIVTEDNNTPTVGNPCANSMCADEEEALNIALIPEGYPDVTLTPFQVRILLDRLFDKLDDLKLGCGINPKFDGHRVRAGGCVLFCQTKATRDWVRSVAGSIKINKIRIRADKPDVLVVLKRVETFFPGPQLEPVRLMKRLMIQNEDLISYIRTWRIAFQRSLPGGTLVAFQIPESHLTLLESKGYLLDYRDRQISIKPVGNRSLPGKQTESKYFKEKDKKNLLEPKHSSEDAAGLTEEIYDMRPGVSTASLTPTPTAGYSLSTDSGMMAHITATERRYVKTEIERRNCGPDGGRGTSPSLVTESDGLLVLRSSGTWYNYVPKAEASSSSSDPIAEWENWEPMEE